VSGEGIHDQGQWGNFFEIMECLCTLSVVIVAQIYV
jgi:hypothetical protein